MMKCLFAFRFAEIKMGAPAVTYTFYVPGELMVEHARNSSAHWGGWMFYRLKAA